MTIENSKSAQEYLDYLNPPKRDLTRFDHMNAMIESLQEAVGRVSGCPEMFGAIELSQMTALDLIATLAPNDVRFTVKEHTSCNDIWNFAPYWANYLAKDRDGTWYWYEIRPEINNANREWNSTHSGQLRPLNTAELQLAPKHMPWYESLISRPDR